MTWAYSAKAQWSAEMKWYVLKQNNLRLVICVATSLSWGWRKKHLSPQGEGDLPPPKWINIAIQYTRRRLFCFYILLFNGFKLFQAEINMYLFF